MMEDKNSKVTEAESTVTLRVDSEADAQSDSSRTDTPSTSDARFAVPGESGEKNTRAHLEVGKNIGHYKLLSLLSEDSSGRTYKAQHTALNRPFALKAVDVDNAQAIERFEQEVEALGKCNHQNLAAIYESGTDESGVKFIVFDLFDGAKLSEIVHDGGPVNPARALNLAIQLCEGILYLERKGIAVRDLRLDDVIITRAGNGFELLKITDYGVAQKRQSTVFSASALSDASTGTTTPGSDASVRMVGVFLLEMISGRQPDNDMELDRIASIMNTFMAPNLVLDLEDNKVRDGLTRIIARALLRGPNSYASVGEILHDLQYLPSFKRSLPTWKMSPARVGFRLLLVSGLVLSCMCFSKVFDMPPSHRTDVPMASQPPAPEKIYSQQIKDRFGRVLYSCDAPDQASAVIEAFKKNVNLAGAELHDIKLRGVVVLAAKLQGARLSHCIFDDVQFRDSNFSSCEMSNSDFVNSKFKHCVFDSAVFSNTHMNSVTFTESQLRGTKFNNCNAGDAIKQKVSGVTLRASELNEAEFNGGVWQHCRFNTPLIDVKASFTLRQSSIAADLVQNSDFTKAEIESSSINVPASSMPSFKNAKNSKLVDRVLK